jgi:hypothetical protein
MMNEFTGEFCHIVLYKNTEGAGIATGYGLDDQEARVQATIGSRIFSSPHCSGAHPASYPVGTRGSFLWVKVQGA